jgi:hypothetical protein
LDLFELQLVESRATVIIPFDDRVIFVRLFNYAEFSGWYSEVAQPLDVISGNKFLVRCGRLREGGFLGTVGIRRCTRV